ncbi:glycoside hydrolase 5 family protein [Phytoactinopolyspora limicola]|uniref:glycoside hydrolase 5 family protein n=1 Tax=Phytoactinopolyspora limicola TaxID=2715536 RepID=UPI0014079722|nr:glycosyl hydrolase [Phytoactinopolyspora limicola]
MTSTLRVGVNYTPTRGWFHHWLDFDLDEVGADLDSIAALGLDHVRVFPLWPLLQPNRTLIRPAAIQQVVSVVDAAAARGLDTSVDVLQGHLSSYDFLPSWVTGWHRRHLFTDPDVVEAQEQLTAALGEALAGRPGFVGLTVGNETNQFAHPYHPDHHRLTTSDTDVWLKRLLRVAQAAAPGGLHCHSFDDDVWFRDDSAVTPDHAVRHGDVTTVHSWVFTGVSKRYAYPHPAYGWFARYLVELAAAWSPDPARPVWLQEVGAPVPHVPAASVAEFTEQTMTNLVSSPELWGVTWWCSHDVDRTLADFPELEYSLGLLTADRQPKPAADVVRRLVPELRRRPRAHARPAVVLGGSSDAAIQPSQTAPGSALFDRWVRLAEDGEPPAIVLARDVHDDQLLAARGIQSLIESDGSRIW